jgi:hypothetical protein
MVRAYNLPESFLVPITPAVATAPIPEEVPLDEAQELV